MKRLLLGLAALLFVAVGVHAQTILPSPGSSSGGTVTSITCNGGLTGGAITTSGTCSLNSPTAHGVLIGNGSSAINATAAGSAGQVLTSNGAGADPTYQTVSGTGTVTSVAMTVPGIMSVAGSPITGAGTLAVSLATETANIVFAGPSSGGAVAPTFRSLVGADLPAPAASTLGGVESLAVVSHKWINTISTAGAPAATQPACADISDAGNACTNSYGSAANTITQGNDSRFGGPTQTSKSAAYGWVVGDCGNQFYHPSADTTARTWTLPANGSQAMQVGCKIDVVNDCSAGVLTIAITTDTLTWFPGSTTGSRAVAACSEVTLTKITTTKWIITGNGISWNDLEAPWVLHRNSGLPPPANDIVDEWALAA